MTASADECRILVADDDPPLQKLIVTALRRSRHGHIEGADNGADAIARLHYDGPWNVLVLDLMMPKLSGWDVLDWMAKHPDHFPQSVIVASAADRKILKELDPKLVNAIMFKPFDVFQLAAYIGAACQLRQRDRRHARLVAELPGSGAR